MDYNQSELFRSDQYSTPTPPVTEDGDDCRHHFIKSHDKWGLFCWRCFHCKEIKEPDIETDYDQMLAHAKKRREQFINALVKWQQAPSNKKGKQWRDSAHQLYWVAKGSFYRLGITEWEIDEGIEALFPQPLDFPVLFPNNRDEIVANRDCRSSGSTDNNHTKDFTRGLVTPSKIPPSKITPSKKSRREKGQGTATLFKSQLRRKGKVYDQWWFQYEEVTKSGKRKKRSRYVSGKKLEKIRELNERKVPVEEILKTLENKA